MGFFFRDRDSKWTCQNTPHTFWTDHQWFGSQKEMDTNVFCNQRTQASPRRLVFSKLCKINTSNQGHLTLVIQGFRTTVDWRSKMHAGWGSCVRWRYALLLFSKLGSWMIMINAEFRICKTWNNKSVFQKWIILTFDRLLVASDFL